MTRVSGCLYSLYLSIQSSHTLDRAGASCHLDILYFYLAHGSYCDHVLLVSLFLHLCILWHIASHTNSWYFLPKPHDMAGDVPPSAWFLPAEGGAGLGVSIQASSHAQPRPSLIRLWPAWTPAIHQWFGPGGHRAENINFAAKPCVCFFLISTYDCVSTSDTASFDFASGMSHNLAFLSMVELHKI